MAGSVAPNLVTDGLILYLDPASPKSYVSGAAVITDLSTNVNSTITGTYVIDTTTYGVPVLSLNNTGSASDGQVQVVTQDLNALAVTQNFTVMFAARKNFYGIGGNNAGNSQLFQGVSNGYNTGWRINESTTGTPGAPFTGNPITNNQYFGFGYNDLNTSLTVASPIGSGNSMCICAFTVSPTTILGFANGGTTSRSNPLTYAPSTSAPRISFTGAGQGSWNGFIGFFMIYNRALSLTELTQNYNVMRKRYNI
jgi:hypothetical protein